MVTREELLKAVEDLLDTEDNTGCSEDLTVVSIKEIDNLKKLVGRK